MDETNYNIDLVFRIILTLDINLPKLPVRISKGIFIITGVLVKGK